MKQKIIHWCAPILGALMLLAGCAQQTNLTELKTDQVSMAYDPEVWTLENQSNVKSTYVCFTHGDSKSSDIGLVIEAYHDTINPADMMDYYKTSFAEELDGQDMRLASQASSDKAWASLSGLCTESSRGEQMVFNVQATATIAGTYVTTLMYVPGTDEDLVTSAEAICDSIKQIPYVAPEPGDYSDKSLDDLTDEDIANMTWDDMVKVMKQTFKFVSFNPLTYHDGVYTAINLGDEEPTDALAERYSESNGIEFSQKLRDISELNGLTLKEHMEDWLTTEVAADITKQDFVVSEISSSEDDTQAAGIYTYSQDGIEYIAITTYQIASSDAWVTNTALVNGSAITENTEQTFDELCVLLQISITWGDVENVD